MGFLQELPDQTQVTSILSGLVGDQSSGTGISGVLTLLEQINPSQMVTDLSGNLNAVSFSEKGSSDGLTGGVLSQFDTLVKNLPQDPNALIAPLSGKLDSLDRLVRTDLAGGLTSSISNLQSLQNLLPQNGETLLHDAVQGFEAVKAEFLSGGLGQLRVWSEDLSSLEQQVTALISSGAGDLEARIIGYLETKVKEITQVVISEQENPADRLATRLDAILSTDRMAALNQHRDAVIQTVNAARQELQNGNTANTAQLDAAVTAFQAFQEDINGITAGLTAALDDAESGPEGVAAALRRQYEQFQSVEIVDLGNVSQRVNEALESVRSTLNGFNLDQVRTELHGVFQSLQDGIGQFNLDQLTARLGELRNQIESVTGDLDSILLEIVASLRAVFSQIKEGLHSLVSSLGEYDADGVFHFYVQRDIEDFLNGIRETIDETLTPLLNGFKDAIRGALNKVKDVLDGVQAQIDSVKSQLQAALQTVSDKLRELDVPGKVEQIGAKLEEMLSSLGEINFDVVVNPVIAQIEEIRDQLRGIDVSGLNDILREALHVALQVVTSIDFPGQITNVLIQEIDKLLQVPKDALNTMKERVEDGLQRVGQLAPDELLRPLDTLFQPVTQALDQLRVEALVEPVAEWYGNVREEVERLSPSVLLKPVVDAYNGIKDTLGSISPDRLTQPIIVTVANFRAELQRLDFSSVTNEIGKAIQSVRGLLAGLTPDLLLAPLVQVYDVVKTALDGLNLETLLAPLSRLFKQLAGPLESLSVENAQRIGEAFAPLTALPAKFDPAQVYTAAAEHWTAARNASQALNIGRLISDLRAPFEALSAAIPSGAPESLAAKVAGLNPLRNETLGSAAMQLQQIQPRLEGIFAQATPPADLVSQYGELRPRLESLVPVWASGSVTPDAIRKALSEYDPSSVVKEAQSVVDTLKTQYGALDPRGLQADLRETFQTLDSALASLSPEALSGLINGVIQVVTDKLDLLNPQLIADELKELWDEVQGILAGIDPAGIIGALEGLANEVKQIIDTLDPAALLSELKDPFEQVRTILDSFSPRAFREALQVVFEEIETILKSIDLGKILEPLVSRLDALRDELERALQRTESAFKEMLTAIPL